MDRNETIRDELKKKRGRIIWHGGEQYLIIDATKNALAILEGFSANGSMGNTRMVAFSQLIYPLRFID